MKYSPDEKLEIIRMVESSSLSVKRTLKQIGVPKSSFYEWYNRFLQDGIDGLYPRPRRQELFWNRIPEKKQDLILKVARRMPEKSSREIACSIMDDYSYYVSESSVYRILKKHDLIAAPVYTVISASDKFSNPTTRVNQLWQTDFTYFKIRYWGWYYLSTILDDYSRYIVAWKLCTTMNTDDVKDTIDLAIENTKAKGVKVVYKPRLLSDNGPCYISSELKNYLTDLEMAHTRGRPYHPMTQGKIERYHRSMKNVILLDNYYSPSELEDRIAEWVEYYNNHRYHESIGNIKPVDKYLGRDLAILQKRRTLKSKTLLIRKKVYMGLLNQSLN